MDHPVEGSLIFFSSKHRAIVTFRYQRLSEIVYFSILPYSFLHIHIFGVFHDYFVVLELSHSSRIQI